MYDITSQDISILGQKIKEYKLKIELINSSLQVLDILTGDCLSCTYDIDSTSDIRRTISLTMLVTSSKYTINETSRIWFNRYLKISLGIITSRSQEIIYYPIGIFIPSENSFTYDTSTRTLEIKATDLMSLFINTPLGSTTKTTIPEGSIIRDALISTISKVTAITKYNIDDIGSIESTGNNIVPYDLDFTETNSVYDVIKKLCELYSGWEFFMDSEIFITQKVPTCINDSVILDYQTIIDKGLLISESISNKFDGIKNVTEIFGEQISTDYYTDVCTNSNSAYSATISGVTALSSGSKYAVKLNISNGVSPTLNINNLGAYSIVDADGSSISASTISDYTVFKFQDSKFYVLGNYQVHAVCVLRSVEPTDSEKAQDKINYNCDTIVYRVSPNNEFTTDKIGIRKDVKSSDNYSSIYSNSLATQRSKYENWKSTRISNTLTLTTQSIFWLDVNQKFTYKTKIDNVVRTWITTKISCSDALSGKIQIEAVEFFPNYPETYE